MKKITIIISGVAFVCATFVFWSKFWLRDSIQPQGKTMLAEESLHEADVDTVVISKSTDIQEKSIDQKLLGQVESPNALMSFIEHTKYPPFSQPITQHAPLESFQPSLESVQSETLFLLESDDSEVRLGISTQRSTYFEEEVISINALAHLNDTQEIDDVTIWLSSVDGDELYRLEPSHQESSWQFDIDTSLINASDWPIEVEARLLVMVNGEALYTFHPFRYQAPVAELNSVGTGSVQEQFLNISLEFDVEQKGYFFITGNLYEQQTNKPLIHLTAEGEMSSLNNKLSLKAHIDALKVSGLEGPYYLADIDITRSAAIGESFDLKGRALESRYHIDRVDFSTFSNIPHHDPHDKERIRVMKAIANISQ
ncbi:hypothetical protein ACFSJY_08125 [Thalassotalea euphylliae]|uniref:hypothetical protein n=1 Tax=Thalassotalea euphylliae TaxID=1655234 RepID=UPI003625B4E1